VRATPEFDLIVVGHETEGCLAAVAGARAGARVALLVPEGAMLGGLLTEDGLAFVDRDSRHLTPPDRSPHDGVFAEFLTRAGVALVALEPHTGDRMLRAMLAEAGVTIVESEWEGVVQEGDRLTALVLPEGGRLTARHFLDATPDADLVESSGGRFTQGFSEYGITRYLGISPLPVVHGVTPERIVETCRALAADPALEAMREQVFGTRAFLELDHGIDYVLVGPPHLGLAYQRWRDAQGFESVYPFEADGFNVAVIGPESTSWNGLIYFSEDPEALLRLSREGADDFFREETARFGRFLREGLGWESATVELPKGVYVRQTRHALDVRHRLTLDEIAQGFSERSVGTFCYYPDFRGFRAVSVPGPLTAHVVLDAGLASNVRNLGVASRAGGYTPFAHSLCRLVQYNVTLGTGLAIAAHLAGDDLGDVDVARVRAELERQGILAADPAGLERNAAIRTALQADPVLRREGVHLA
jgi:hypothetical protein